MHIYIYIYGERERERERLHALTSFPLLYKLGGKDDKFNSGRQKSAGPTLALCWTSMLWILIPTFRVLAVTRTLCKSSVFFIFEGWMPGVLDENVCEYSFSVFAYPGYHRVEIDVFQLRQKIEICNPPRPDISCNY